MKLIITLVSYKCDAFTAQFPTSTSAMVDFNIEIIKDRRFLFEHDLHPRHFQTATS
ncbi:BQ5605_C009g05440 [Microbotryum silenes-dioicae]|uniref:BQ5605_C009g05440 protein n=1 Tax=Microbotryum silenes-dioicae TaxID=796604 RepID=A0A2X0PEN3_9BASI|nr:BQ5605_C009g05440 [Microbotryum silenes-dioicae]